MPGRPPRAGRPDRPLPRLHPAAGLQTCDAERAQQVEWSTGRAQSPSPPSRWSWRCYGMAVSPKSTCGSPNAPGPQAPASGAWLEGGEAVQAGLLRRDQGSLVPSTCEVTARGPQSAPGRGPRRAPPAGTLTSDSQPPGPSATRWPQPAGQRDGGSEGRGLMIPSAVTAEGVTVPQPWGKKPGKCPLKPEVFLVLLTQSLRTQGSRRGSGPGRAWCRPRGSRCSPGPRGGCVRDMQMPATRAS